MLTAIVKARGWIDDIRLGRIIPADQNLHECYGDRGEDRGRSMLCSAL
jgi:hypothetical protein